MALLSAGLLVGCGDEEPEDGSTTVASSVGQTTGSDGSTSEASEASESSDASSSGMSAVVYEDDVQPIWNANCSCHLMGSSGTMTAPFLTLNPDMSIGQLVGIASEQSALARVEASDPEASYLWLKLEGTHAAMGSGDQMPPTAPLSEEDMDVVRSWIASGANP